MYKLEKSFLIIIILLLIFFNSYSQNIPKEDYIKSNRVSGSVLGNDNGAGIKGGAYLYFNDSCVILHFDGLGNKTIYFKIYQKYWNAEDRHIVIVCYDSTKTATYTNKNELGRFTPDLSITLDYNAKVTFQEKTKSTTTKYIDVNCWFYGKGFMISFGSEAKSQPNNIPLIRKKLFKTIIG